MKRCKLPVLKAKPQSGSDSKPEKTLFPDNRQSKSWGKLQKNQQDGCQDNDGQPLPALSEQTDKKSRRDHRGRDIDQIITDQNST